MASLPPDFVQAKQDVLLHGSSVNIVRRCGATLTQLLRARFNCEASINGLDLDTSMSKPTIAPEKRLEATLLSGVKVSVWKADLTNFTVKAVVNAANSKLQHYGGLALALSEAGGPSIQTDSDDYVRKHGDVRTGEAVLFSAARLKCDKIIHAVGPQLSFKPNQHEVSASRPQLQRAVRSILELVEKHHIHTVAIPAISSGIFNYPVSDCADTMVTEVKKFYGSSRSQRFRPTEVFLVNNDEPTVKEMERACDQKLSPPPSYSQAASTSNKPTTRGSKGVINLGFVQVILRRGKLEEQKMDVIVNTAAANRDLSQGRVSSTLLKRAGANIQSEMHTKPLSGSIVITKSYNLLSKEVYHIFCPDRNTAGSHQSLFRSIQDCLNFAAGSGHHSIAFPAIGTGALNFSRNEIAEVMWNAVMDFSQRSRQPLEVHFVIFPSDEAVFKAFEEELKCLRSKAPQMEVQATAAWSVEGRPHLQADPSISLSSPSEESVMEAKAWLTGLLFNSFNTACISNNFISLLGERQLIELSQCVSGTVEVEEFQEKGHCGFIVRGERAEDIAVTAVNIEHILSQTQAEFINEEQEALTAAGQRRVRAERSPVSRRSHPEIRSVVSELRKQGLEVLKAEKVDNFVLEKLFLHHQSQKSSPSVKMFQRVSAQFCDLVRLIGSRPECAPPDDPVLGEGVYFTDDVRTALNLWTAPRGERFVYLVLSEVLKGRSGPGTPGLILPPVKVSDPTQRYDSVEHPTGVTVVFDHLQALPRYILTCSGSEGGAMTSL